MNNIVEWPAVTGLKYNPKFWISVGDSRKSKKWKNKEMYWSELLGRLQRPTWTNETLDEYLKKKKDEQDDIKDVGGFVGGTISGGRRKAGSVTSRTLLTFDLDNAPEGFVQAMQLEYMDTAWAIYSTHKHRPEAPRLRLIMPLKDPIGPEEYEAVMRKMAEKIGMEYMDHTTFQPERLMYWPSVSDKAEYVNEYNDAEPLDAQDILDEYPDWTDRSFWPGLEEEGKRATAPGKKIQDPTEKDGLIGAFCRTYDVPAAINEFLSSVYRKESDTRYTYINGSTSNGVVIYDDGRFCYSNHSTDPARGQSLNAFDLVRIHLFGDLDESAKEGTRSDRLPSFKEMIELVRNDPGCKKTTADERRAEALADFDGEEGDEWSTMTLDKNNDYEPSVENLLKIFESNKGLQGIALNLMSGFVELRSPVPWRKDLSEWKDADDSNLYVYLVTTYKCNFKRADISDVLKKTAGERAFHPVREYLNSLPEWDGVKRAERLFIDYLGAEDSQYTEAVTRKWLLAAVTRAFRPGCKFDYIPVLSGPGGIGKSTMASKLGVDWFSDNLSFEDMKDKTAAEKIQGTWINEIGELKGMRKTEVESIKGFISRTSDQYRAAYAKNVEKHERGCVFIGTSNADDYLKDITGNRRFWPVDCTEVGNKKVWDMTAEDVKQIWAEVMTWYRKGDEDLLLSESLEAIAAAKQIGALEQDERMGLVQTYLERKLPPNWEEKDLSDRRLWLDDGEEPEDGKVRESVSVMEIWAECFRMNPAAKRRQDSDDIVRILLQLGWERPKKAVRRIPIYGLQRLFYRKA